MCGGSRPWAAARAGPQLAALRKAAFDVGETTDIGAGQHVAYQVSLLPHRLMDRTDITASQQQYHRVAHPLLPRKMLRRPQP